MSSHSVRVAGYVILVGLALCARRRERSRASTGDGVWPPFWLLTAGLLAVMAVGRAGDIGSLLSDLGRRRAADSGWYELRRPLQAVVVVSLGFGWFVTVTMACWGSPDRRRRYLPMGLVAFTLAAFAAVRMVSLHEIDALLYRREISGIRLATLIEMTLLAVAGLTTWWVPADRKASNEPPRVLRQLGSTHDQTIG